MPEDKFGKVARYAMQLTEEVEIIAHSVGVSEPRQIRRRHVLIVQPDGRTIPMAELFPRTQSSDEGIADLA